MLWVIGYLGLSLVVVVLFCALAVGGLPDGN